MVHAQSNDAAQFSREGFAHPVQNVVALGVQPGMQVADFGSGSGAYVLALAEALAGNGRVYALDIQKDLLRRTHNEALKRGYTNVEIVWGDLEKKGGSKMIDELLDLALISNLLFQVEDKQAVVTEAARVLRPNGRLAVIDWSESFGGMGPQKEDIVPKTDVLTFAREAGLTFVNEFAAGAHHFGLLFRKSEDV